MIPTNTWQAYNFRDADGNGWGDTWYAKGAQSTAALGRAVHPPRRAAAVAQVRRRLPPLALLDGQDAGHHHRVRPRDDPDRGRAAPALRLRDLRRPHRVRDEARVRPDRGLPQPRRQPGLPLREQLLLGGAPARAALSGGRDSGASMGRPESGLLGVQYRANDDGRIQQPVRRPLGDDGAVALGGNRPRRRRHLRRGARRLRDRDRPDDAVHAGRHDRARRHPRRLRPRPDRADDLLRDRRRREGLRRRARSTSAAARWCRRIRRMLENLWARLATP